MTQSTDKPIPERWQSVVALSQRSPNHRNWHDDLKHCAGELGAAEAALRWIAEYDGGQYAWLVLKAKDAK